MNNTVELTLDQNFILKLFYDKPKFKLIYSKKIRNEIWDDFIKNRNIKQFREIEKLVPALFFEMKKALDSEKNIQPAVFSECVYTQGLSNQFDLNIFKNHLDGSTHSLNSINYEDKKLKDFVIRYSYSNVDFSKQLIQAGGAGAVDSAFISKIENKIALIEFKESYARTSEPDLPKYGEDGYIKSSPEFDAEYPQFKSMLEEQLEKKLNVFEHLGKNVNDFSVNGIKQAVLDNYKGKKFADVICTEDKKGYLVLLPVHDVSRWANLEGEIRPSGRNSYKVWTPNRLLETIKNLNGTISDNVVSISRSKITSAKERGGRKISRYKLNSLFFVRKKDVQFHGDNATFEINSIRQLNPSITAKMNFKELDFDEVKNFYMEKIK